tara:strand:- start:630 stop:1166 length:537 start_codon:yes stop_codon:yes gene_type:complete
VKTKNLEKVFDTFGKKVVGRARSILSSKSVSGKLADSLGYQLKVYDSGALELQFLGAGYARLVDEGVRGSTGKAHPKKGKVLAPKSPFKYTNKQPPSNVIDKWVVRKGLGAARDEQGRFIPRKSLVFAIAKSIKLYGIEPSNFFTDSLNKEIKNLPKEIARAYAQDAGKFIRTVTQNI